MEAKRIQRITGWTRYLTGVMVGALSLMGCSSKLSVTVANAPKKSASSLLPPEDSRSKTFAPGDVSNSWGEDEGAYAGFSVTLPFESFRDSVLSVTVKLTQDASQAYAFSIVGNRAVGQPYTMSLPRIMLASLGLHLTASQINVQMTPLDTQGKAIGAQRLLTASEFKINDQTVVVTLSQWATLSLQAQPEFAGPLVSSAAAITNIASPRWFWTATSSGTFRYALDNSDMAAVTSTTQATEFKPTSSLDEGAHTLYVQEQNQAGYWSATGKFTVVIDLTPPTIPMVIGLSPINNAKPTWSWTGAADGSGQYRYKLDDSDFTNGATDAGTAVTFVPSVALSEGPHTLYVQELDAAGNWSASGSRTITIDVTAPGAFAIVAPASPSVADPIIAWSASSASDSYTLKVARNSTCTDVVQTAAGLTATSLAITPVFSGTYYICVSAFDAAGNSTAASNSPVSFVVPEPVVLGQIGPTASNLDKGFTQASRIASDGIHLVISDYNNNRVLIWNTIPTSNNTPPDVVIGQPNLVSPYQNNGGLSKGFFYPFGVDICGGKLFVADVNNNRILMWNSIPAANFQGADLVLGQPDLASNETNNGGVSASSLNKPHGLRCNGSRLFVADTTNHRILVWNSLPVSNGQAADLVLGQPDFVSNTQNNGGVSAASLSNPRDVTFANSKLYVVDTSNHRALIWNSLTGAHGQNADVVLGQTSMSTNTQNSGGLSAASFSSPYGIYVGGNRLYIADYVNSRVLIWNSIPTVNKAPADLVWGQPSMVVNSRNNGGLSGTSSNYPCGLTGDGSRLYVADTYNHRVLIWNHTVTASQDPPDLILGSLSMSTASVGGGPVGATSISFPQSAQFDGTHLIGNDYYNNRVMIWNSLPTSHNQPADIVLGQANMTSVMPNAGGSAASTSISLPLGAASDGTRLFISDYGNARVLMWNTFPTSNQTPADIVLGQSSFTSTTANAGGLSASSINGPRRLCLSGTKLFVVDSLNNRILIWNNFPTVNKQAADVVVGQPDMSSNAAGAASTGMNFPVAVHCDANRLIVSDSSNHRVLLWNAIPTTNGQGADLVLGQPDFNTVTSPSTANLTLWSPNGVNYGDGHLYVRDSWARILVWNSLPTTNGQAPDRVIGKPDFTSTTSTGMTLNSIWGPGLESDPVRLTIADQTNNRILMIPHGLPTFVSAAPVGIPSPISAATTLNVSMTGNGGAVTSYRYKVGVAATTDCANISGYSASVNFSTPITDNISGLADGKIALCTITQNAAGTWQPVSMATVNTWNKSTAGMGAFAIVSPTSVPITNTTPIVSWSAASGAATYDLTLATDWSCAAPVVSFTGISSTSQVLSAVSDGTYTLCLTARAAGGGIAEPTNNHLAITIDSAAPGAFSIIGPALTNSATPTVLWGGSVGAWSYNLKIATTSGCAAPLQTYTGIESTSQTLTSVLSDGPYFACLSAIDGAGNVTAAANTNFVFTVDTTPPGAFALIGPGATTTSPIPLIAWQSSATATTYRLIVASDSACASTVLQTYAGLTTTSKRLLPLIDGIYYACVTSYDAALNPMVASNSPYNFTVANGTIAIGRPNLTTNGLEDGLGTIPSGGMIDGTRMFVADTGNNRILIWNSIPTANQTLPDVVLGQTSLTAMASGNTTQSRMYFPSDVFSDGTSLYVTDSTSNRVLIWNTIPTINNAPADLVLGQPSFTAATANNGGISAQSMSNPYRVYSDGSKLFVTDRGNHRVLIWNTIPTVNQQPADVVIGQPNMTSLTANNGGISAATLNSPSGVYKTGTALFIADQSNNRVLKWNAVPTINGAAADIVLGQANMTAITTGFTAQTLSGPNGLTATGSKLLVTDGTNSRILIWNAIPTATQTAADVVLGQPNMTTNSSTVITAQNLYGPRSVSTNGTKVMAVDTGNGRALIWNNIPTVNQTAADVEFGHTGMTQGGYNGDLTGTARPMGISSDGSKYFAADYNNNRVLIWNSSPSSTGQSPDVVVGQSDLISNKPGATALKLFNPIFAAGDGTRLFVADAQNHRVLIYSTVPTAHNATATYVLGQSNMTASAANGGGSVSALTLNAPQGVASDGTNLAVADTSNNRVLIWTSMPTSNQPAANIVLGQPSMTVNTANNGGISAQTLNGPKNVVIKSGKLFVSDYSNHRILIWNSIPTSNQQAADVVLGQPSMTSNNSNNGGKSSRSLYFPIHIHCDGTSLYVADSLNHRVLVWNTIPTLNQQAADYVFGQADFATTSANYSGVNATGLQLPWGVFGDSNKLYIGDTNNNRILAVPLQ